MKKLIILLGVIFVILASAFIWLRYSNWQVSGSNKTELIRLEESIKGLQLITDKDFKIRLIEYLDVEEKKDYKKVYNYISQQYLNINYPNVKNAEEFQKARGDKYMWEVGIKYTEVINFVVINTTNYQVDLKFQYYAEDVEGQGKMRMFFVKEDNLWKYVDEKILEKQIL